MKALRSFTAVTISFACSDTTIKPISSLSIITLLKVLTKKLFFIVSAKVIGCSSYWFKMISLILSFSSSSSLSCIFGLIESPFNVSSIIKSDLEKTL